MKNFNFFLTINHTYSLSAKFEPLNSSESLPFPLNGSILTKIVVTAYLLINFLIGCSLRSKIFAFTKTQKVKDNPINVFIRLDQINGIYMALNIIYTISVIYLEFPLSTLIGIEGCNWMDLLGTAYLIGQSTWSCFIAGYRVLYIKYQTFFKYGIKEKKFVILLTILGHLFIIYSSCLLAYFDKGISFKLCSHYSSIDLRILKVRKLKTF